FPVTRERVTLDRKPDKARRCRQVQPELALSSFCLQQLEEAVVFSSKPRTFCSSGWLLRQSVCTMSCGPQHFFLPIPLARLKVDTSTNIIVSPSLLFLYIR